MGRTIPPYRLAVEHEISHTWKKFARMLRREEKAFFEDLINTIRSYTSEAGAAAFPSVIDGMFLSAIFAHTKELKELRNSIKEVQKTIEQLKNSRLDP
jgi:polyhydroxyalkanoate synthesis regulator phasin